MSLNEKIMTPGEAFRITGIASFGTPGSPRPRVNVVSMDLPAELNCGNSSIPSAVANALSVSSNVRIRVAPDN